MLIIQGDFIMDDKLIQTETNSLSGATNIIGQFVTNAITSDHGSISESEIATTNVGTEKISSFNDEDKRLIAQKSENEHEEKQTVTREKFKTIRTGLIASCVITSVALLVITPLYLSSKV